LLPFVYQQLNYNFKAQLFMISLWTVSINRWNHSDFESYQHLEKVSGIDKST